MYCTARTLARFSLKCRLKLRGCQKERKDFTEGSEKMKSEKMLWLYPAYLRHQQLYRPGNT